jgi:hypothetical protein
MSRIVSKSVCRYVLSRSQRAIWRGKRADPEAADARGARGVIHQGGAPSCGSAWRRPLARSTHSIDPAPVGVARSHADSVAIDEDSRPRCAKREPVPVARRAPRDAPRRTVGTRGAPVEHRTHEATGGTLDRALVTEMPVGLAGHEPVAFAATATRRRATRVAGDFAHGHLLSVTVDVGLAARTGRAQRSVDLAVAARKNGCVPVAPRPRDGLRTPDPIDARVRGEATCFFDFEATRAQEGAVDERALARIVVRTRDELRPVAARHRSGMSFTEASRAFLPRDMETAADGVAGSGSGQAAENRVPSVARKPKLDAGSRIANVRRVVRVSAARDTRTPSRDGRDAGGRGRCGARVFKRRRGS